MASWPPAKEAPSNKLGGGEGMEFRFLSFHLEEVVPPISFSLHVATQYSYMFRWALCAGIDTTTRHDDASWLHLTLVDLPYTYIYVYRSVIVCCVLVYTYGV
jgi:hypothetical protein